MDRNADRRPVPLDLLGGDTRFMNTTSSISHSRRQFLATLAATATATAWGREFGPEAAPVRYPDPDVVVLDERFAKYKIGNTPIQRLHCGTLWAEGPAWNARRAAT